MRWARRNKVEDREDFRDLLTIIRAMDDAWLDAMDKNKPAGQGSASQPEVRGGPIVYSTRAMSPELFDSIFPL